MKKFQKIFIRAVSLADQVFFSLANFILTIILARYFSEVQFAGYGIGLSIALTIQGVQRNCYIVQNAVLLPEILRRRSAGVLGEQAICWSALLLLEAAAAVLVYSVTDVELYRAVALSTIICSLIATQLEFDRIMFIKHERYFRPFLAAFGFLCLIGAIFFFVPRYEISFECVMALIGVFTLVKMLWLFASVGRPDFVLGWHLVRRDFKKYFYSSVVGVLGYSGHNHVPLFILGAVAAPLQAAVFVAMRGLMQPLQIIVRSLDIIDKNFFQQQVGESSGGVRRVFLKQMGLYAFLSVCVMLLVFVFGEFIIDLAYGKKYASYSYILVGWTLIFSMLAMTFPLETVIVQAGKLNTYNTYRIFAGIVGTIIAFMLCDTLGAMGAVIASFSGWLVSFALALWLVWPVVKSGEDTE